MASTPHHRSCNAPLAALVAIVPFLAPKTSAEVLFRSGFEGVRIEPYGRHDQHGRIRGVDTETGDDWDRFRGEFDDLYLFHLVGANASNDYARTDLPVDPASGDQSLRMTVLEDLPGDGFTTRSELSIFPRDEPDAVFRDDGYVKYRMKLGPELAEAWPARWINFFEVKEDLVEERGQRRENFRFNFNVLRGHDGEPYWNLTTEDTSLRESEIEANLDNHEVAVLVDEWMEIEAYWKQHESEGELFLGVNGQTVFDFKGRTQHATDPQSVRFWSPLKNYRAAGWLEGEREVSVLYDDIEFRRTRPVPEPGSAALLACGVGLLTRRTRESM